MSAHRNHHGREQAGLDHSRLMSEVDRLIGRGIPLAMAVVSGSLDPAVCREMKNAIARVADYVAWGIHGSTCIVVFSAPLLRGLQPFWNELSRRAPELVAGVATSQDGMDHSQLLHAAHFAHSRSLTQRTRLTVLDTMEIGHD